MFALSGWQAIGVLRTAAAAASEAKHSASAANQEAQQAKQDAQTASENLKVVEKEARAAAQRIEAVDERSRVPSKIIPRMSFLFFAWVSWEADQNYLQSNKWLDSKRLASWRQDEGRCRGSTCRTAGRARLLSPFGSGSHTIRLKREQTPKGYYHSDFAEASTSAFPPNQTATTPQPLSQNKNLQFSNTRQNALLRLRKPHFSARREREWCCGGWKPA